MIQRLEPADAVLAGARLAVNIRSCEAGDEAEMAHAALLQHAIDQGYIERDDYSAGILAFSVNAKGIARRRELRQAGVIP